jgi:hypothetical protein
MLNLIGLTPVYARMLPGPVVSNNAASLIA